MKEYISVQAMTSAGSSKAPDEITLSFVGPLGGNQGCAFITPDAGEGLFRDLFKALVKMGRTDLIERMAADALKVHAGAEEEPKSNFRYQRMTLKEVQDQNSKRKRRYRR